MKKCRWKSDFKTCSTESLWCIISSSSAIFMIYFPLQNYFLSLTALCWAVFVPGGPCLLQTVEYLLESWTFQGFEPNLGKHPLPSQNLCASSVLIDKWNGLFTNLCVLDLCPYTSCTCAHACYIYPFPPWETHGVSVYEAVSACSPTAYKFPWSPFRITTTPLLNNLCFT